MKMKPYRDHIGGSITIAVTSTDNPVPMPKPEPKVEPSAAKTEKTRKSKSIKKPAK